MGGFLAPFIRTGAALFPATTARKGRPARTRYPRARRRPKRHALTCRFGRT